MAEYHSKCLGALRLGAVISSLVKSPLTPQSDNITESIDKYALCQSVTVLGRVALLVWVYFGGEDVEVFGRFSAWPLVNELG